MISNSFLLSKNKIYTWKHWGPFHPLLPCPGWYKETKHGQQEKSYVVVSCHTAEHLDKDLTLLSAFSPSLITLSLLLFLFPMGIPWNLKPHFGIFHQFHQTLHAIPKHSKFHLHDLNTNTGVSMSKNNAKFL